MNPNRKNLANAFLAAPITAAATTMTYVAGYGAGKPAVPYFDTLTPQGQLSTMGNSEIVQVTALSGDTATIVRARKGTDAKAFPAGTIASNGIYVEDKYGSDNMDWATLTVAFKARRSTNQNSAGGGTIDFIPDSEYYDYGDCYSTSSGLFTAPAKGIYHFTASAYTETTTTGRAFFQSRGTATPGGERPIDGDANYYKRAFGSWEVYMEPGQTFGVEFYTGAVNQLNNVNTWFAGHLVSRVA